jgi:ribonuclease P protein component
VKNTIKSSNEISSLFKTAHKITTGSFIALLHKADEERGPKGRVAFIAGKRLGSAPQRNRAKRLMREAAREEGFPRRDFDVVFIARERTAKNSLEAVLSDMKHLERRLKGVSP